MCVFSSLAHFSPASLRSEKENQVWLISKEMENQALNELEWTWSLAPSSSKEIWESLHAEIVFSRRDAPPRAPTHTLARGLLFSRSFTVWRKKRRELMMCIYDNETKLKLPYWLNGICARSALSRCMQHFIWYPAVTNWRRETILTRRNHAARSCLVKYAKRSQSGTYNKVESVSRAKKCRHSGGSAFKTITRSTLPFICSNLLNQLWYSSKL